MANSFVVYPSQTGGTTDYSIPFEYLDQSFVKATVDGVPTPLTFVSTYMVRFAPGPVGDLKIYRETAKEAINEYTNGSILDASDLNVSFLQTVHMTEEVVDNTITNDIDGDWDAGNLRVKNVADPVNQQDVATKNWTETAGGSFVTQAGNHAANAKAQADRSKSEADKSEASSQTALTRQNEATAQANRSKNEADRSTTNADRSTTQADRSNTQANRSRDEADRSTTQANRSTTEADRSKSEADRSTTQASASAASAETATTKASEASSSATTAGQFAAAAQQSNVEAAGYSAQAKAYRDEAQGFRNEAKGYADQLNADNLLTKDGNLAGIADPAAARSNIGAASTSLVTQGEDGLMRASDKQKIDAIGSMANRNIYISTAGPSGGADGDIWFQYV